MEVVVGTVEAATSDATPGTTPGTTSGITGAGCTTAGTGGMAGSGFTSGTGTTLVFSFGSGLIGTPPCRGLSLNVGVSTTDLLDVKIGRGRRKIGKGDFTHSKLFTPLVGTVVGTGVLSVGTEAAVALGLLTVTATKNSMGGAAIWKTFAAVRTGRSKLKKDDIRILSWWSYDLYG